MSLDDVRSGIRERIRKSGADVAVAFRTLDGRDELFIQPDFAVSQRGTQWGPFPTTVTAGGRVERLGCMPADAL